MNKKILTGLSVFALVAGFWACGDGSVEALNDDDLTVKGFLEESDVDTAAQSGFFKPEDIETAKADCLLNEACKKAMDKASGEEVVPTSEAAIPTSYSPDAPTNPSSSSPKGPVVNYSSQQVSPVNGSSSSSAGGGSQTTTTSSSAATIADWTNPDASCAVKTTSAIEKGNTATWTIDMVGACPDYLHDKAGNKACKDAFASADCEMTLTGSTEKTTTVKCNASTVSATYPSIGSYGAKIKVGDHVHDCSGKVEVKGSPVTGCECTVDENAPNVTNEAQTVTWTVSACETQAAESGYTYKWTGATGSGNTGTASFSEKGETVTPSVVVTNKENASKTVTCPTATAIDLTQPDNFSCSVSPKSINLGGSFTFTVSGYSGSIYGASLTGEDGYSTGYTTSTSFTISPTQAGVIGYEYSITNGSDGTGACVQYVSVTDNSDSWTSKSVSFVWSQNETFATDTVYTLSYPGDPWGGTQGTLYCRGSVAFSCGGTSYSGNSEYRISSARSGCATLKVLGGGSLTCAFGSY